MDSIKLPEQCCSLIHPGPAAARPGVVLEGSASGGAAEIPDQISGVYSAGGLWGHHLFKPVALRVTAHCFAGQIYVDRTAAVYDLHSGSLTRGMIVPTPIMPPALGAHKSAAETKRAHQ